MSVTRRGLVRIVPVVILVLASPGIATAMADEALDSTLSPYFFVDSRDPTRDRLPLESTSVQVDISGVIADVTVRQTYKNDGERPINATYVFPASTRAAVHAMRMVIDGQVIVARIREKQQARKEFDEAKQQGKSASLLEQQRPNVFTMKVANIMPGDRIDVELGYTELLVPTDSVYEFVYPTVVGPRYTGPGHEAEVTIDPWVTNPYMREGEPPPYEFALTGTIAAGMPLKALDCPTHDLRIDWTGSSTASLELEPSEITGGDRDFVLRYRLAGDEIASGLMLYEGEKENFFLLMVQPPERVAPSDIPPREYVFIVDVSGSMSGFPLDTAKGLMADLIGRLRATDSFNVILFSGSARVMAPRSISATVSNVEAAISFIDHQRGGGGTELLRAIAQAMDLPHLDGTARSFVVVTDGYISAERDVFDYIRSNLGRANVFSFGIGSSVNRFLIEGIARAGMGEPFVVTRPAEAAEAADRFRAYIESPVLTDIDVRYDGFDAYDVEPAAVPDVLANRPILIQGKWRGSPTGAITVSGVSGAGRYHRTFDAHAFQASDDNEALSYLWARTRIANLSDLAFHPGPDDIAAVTTLGLQYNLLTRYTSFVAVYDVIRNPGEPGDETQQPLPLPRGVSHLAVGVGDEPEMWLMLAVLAATVGGGWFLRRSSWIAG